MKCQQRFNIPLFEEYSQKLSHVHGAGCSSNGLSTQTPKPERTSNNHVKIKRVGLHKICTFTSVFVISFLKRQNFKLISQKVDSIRPNFHETNAQCEKRSEHVPKRSKNSKTRIEKTRNTHLSIEKVERQINKRENMTRTYMYYMIPTGVTYSLARLYYLDGSYGYCNVCCSTSIKWVSARTQLVWLWKVSKQREHLFGTF